MPLFLSFFPFLLLVRLINVNFPPFPYLVLILVNIVAEFFPQLFPLFCVSRCCVWPLDEDNIFNCEKTVLSQGIHTREMSKKLDRFGSKVKQAVEEWASAIVAVSSSAATAILSNGGPLPSGSSAIVEKITTRLGEDSINIIGLYGTSDARKKDIVKTVARRIEREGWYDKVVKTSVVSKRKTRFSLSRTPEVRADVKRIQGKIGGKLGLQLDGQASMEERARCLKEKILEEGRVLIILDDLRCRIDLASIGIPFGCKILLVAAAALALPGGMNIQERYCAD